MYQILSPYRLGRAQGDPVVDDRSIAQKQVHPQTDSESGSQQLACRRHVFSTWDEGKKPVTASLWTMKPRMLTYQDIPVEPAEHQQNEMNSSHMTKTKWGRML